jgi:hypothetical protein
VAGDPLLVERLPYGRMTVAELEPRALESSHPGDGGGPLTKFHGVAPTRATLDRL